VAQEKDPRESSSPILFAGIANSYFNAFDIIWLSNFEQVHPFHWDKSLIFHPISNLLGVCIETSIKGLLVCRGLNCPRTHNIEKLLNLLGDNELELTIAKDLSGLSIPEEVRDANSDKDRPTLEAMYRRHHYHIHMLNRVYDRPFASRYPVLGGHCLPDLFALRIIADRLSKELHLEMRHWHPSKN
jgi:hypothetical protein